jgi:hypothetical protein
MASTSFTYRSASLFIGVFCAASAIAQVASNAAARSARVIDNAPEWSV